MDVAKSVALEKPVVTPAFRHGSNAISLSDALVMDKPEKDFELDPLR